ncbi:universal stress protein [Lacihabitans sp. LS3-19]|uniref:universal stress protein n=1 Tax=Lacihabitans sp. LS3-19 TaxID=2487335 RepID=UPI0020CCE20C|nr:universal stress protein [Lacihabitans sp. LS3-19]MCP9767044.1 universal stress protein [Lacihabitans sp. LS3-19]
MKTILFPTDFSPNAVHASKFAAELARKLDAKLILLHCFTVPASFENMISNDIANSIQLVEEVVTNNLKSFTLELLKDSGLPEVQVQQVVDYGFVTDGILVTAKKYKVDFIVIGTKGASNFLDKWIGSTTINIVHKALCPVWVVPEKASLDFPSKILYAADYKENEVIATSFMIDLDRLLGTSTTVVHVKDYFDQEIQSKDQKITDKLEQVFEMEDIVFEDIIHLHIIKGLENYIKRYQMDVLAMAIHDKSMFTKLFNTSVSNHFLQDSNHIMLTFRN